MKWLMGLGGLVVVAVCASAGPMKDPRAAVVPTKVVVLIPAKEGGIPAGAKIKGIELPRKTAAKQALRDVRYQDGKAEPRLDGTYVVKDARVTLDKGRVVRCRILVAVDSMGTALRNLRYGGPMHARVGQGTGTWYSYTAEFDTPAPPGARRQAK